MERNELDKNAMGGTELMGAGLEKYCDPELLKHFQIIRSRVREIDPNRIPILWLHDLPGDPESQHLRDPKLRERFAKIVMVSDWQMQMYNAYLGVPYRECVIMKNAIDPIPSSMIDKRGEEIRLIYHPTPHRGLEILVPVFEELCKKHDNIVLDVFSSFKLYGWEQRDQQYEAVIQRCKDHPKINYHGSVSNDVLRAHIAKAHIFAYPSIWQETSCICAMEAMTAGTLMVMPNLAALPETSAGYAMMYQYSEDVNEHANAFYQLLDNAIEAWKGLSEPLVHHINAQKSHADKMYSWERRKVEWNSLLRSLLVKHQACKA